MRRICILSILGSFFFILGLQAQNSIDKEEFDRILHSAESGNLEDQVTLGNLYMNGVGTQKNAKEAYRWYSIASTQDYGPAYYNLGYCHEKGKGVPKNYEKAFMLYKLAAKKDYPMGIYALGVCYEEGIGVKANLESALEYYIAAASKGDAFAFAIYKVGLFQEIGLGGFEPDRDKALDYYLKLDKNNITIPNDDPIRRLADGGNAKAMYLMGMRDPLSKDAKLWFKDAYKNGDPNAAYQLAQIYDYGFGEKIDPDKALLYYKYAAEAGVAEAMFELGTIYRTGKFIGTPDPNRAKKWFAAAAAAGIDYANKCVEEIEQQQSAEGKE